MSSRHHVAAVVALANAPVLSVDDLFNSKCSLPMTDRVVTDMSWQALPPFAVAAIS